jgi:hypothetical protein
MDLPIYAIVGMRPVKAVATPDGGMDVLALDWASGGFLRDMRYCTCLITGQDDVQEISAMEVDFLTEEEFEKRVAEIQRNGGRAD